MKKLSLLVCVVLLGTITFGKTLNIGVTQIVEHAALDAAKVGFEKALKDNKVDITLDYQIAQGDMTNQQLITNQFVQKKVDMIYAISTPSAQSALNSTKNIPILFSAITDPKSAGLVGGNITGTSDLVPADKVLEELKKVLPTTKKIGIIYNTSEKNSEFTNAQVEAAAKKIGIEVVKMGVTSLSDIPSAMDVLVKKIDVLYMTTDNLVTSASDLIIQKATKANKPVVAAIDDQVKKGALFGLVINYEDLGYQTGLMAVKIFNGEKAGNIPNEVSKKFEILKNEVVAKKYNVTFTK